VNECERIADQLRRSMDGDAWHGPALRELLKDVPPATAARKPARSAHSIWEILLHVTAWTDAVRRRLLGDPSRLTPEEDWPAVGNPTAAAWIAARDRLEQAHRRLLEEIANVPLDRLDQPIVPGASSVYVTLHGLVQHHLYHAGQIALLKKIVGVR
jgi:uncharacterized damage-inducible protein DinB